ncbi:MAG: 50S ribosomal protein L3 [Bacteroidota bacterium]|jgi:large subunit ribosomal protein L3|nr:50S ribosomal protein L3 [Bacteroidota bacterium]MEC7851283.1 50S ribosomal protein L3 [Bacteroidota bacterium]MEC8702883.1 50S ribosomal protein L3 [Bacteroidota bacterium]|tara:strand:- start:281 stop:913 length:633 start_codon:yes stop_codon:yes gene_type:complete
MSGIIGKKLGMTSLFDSKGKSVGCTVIEAGPCFVTQIKDRDKDGYRAIQLAYDDLKTNKANKSAQGHFAKSGVTPKRKIVEFRNFRKEFDSKVKLGMEIKIQDVFNENEFLDVTSVSKGKGFQGVVKRHNFGGVGQNTHGQHNRNRAPGSIGAGSTPSRVFKGMRMAGRTGGEKVTVQNLKILKIDQKDNLIYVGGSVPGSNNTYVVLSN